MTAPFRLLVTGSRDWPADRVEPIRAAMLAAIGDATSAVLVVGDCPTGVDKIATLAWEQWRRDDPRRFLAIDRDLGKAHWRTEGKSAGPNRNQRMCQSGADMCLAFPLGPSRGTRDCVTRARAAGIPVEEWSAVTTS